MQGITWLIRQFADLIGLRSATLADRLERADNQRRNEIFRHLIDEGESETILVLLVDSRDLFPDPCDPDWAYEWINDHPGICVRELPPAN